MHIKKCLCGILACVLSLVSTFVITPTADAAGTVHWLQGDINDKGNAVLNGIEEVSTIPQTAEEQVVVDDIDNPAYTAYVKTMTTFPHEKELIELIDSNIKHIYEAPHILTVEFEEDDGTRVFKNCSGIWFDLAIDKSGVRNGHTVEEVNEYLKEIGSKQYYEYITHPNGDSIYHIYAPGEEWCAANGIDMDNEEFMMEVWISLCNKFGFKAGWDENPTDILPKFKHGENYGTYFDLDPTKYGTGEEKVEVKLYADGRTEYPSGAVKYTDGTIKYPEGYEPFDYKHANITLPIDVTGEETMSERISSLKGDADVNGQVDLADLTTVAKYNLNNEAYPLANNTAYANADMNGDDVVDGLDTSALIENQLGKK